MVRVLTLKVPKPRLCLGCIDLQTASEVITIFTLINKVSGFYGILSLFTGAQISALQLSMYIWSIIGTIVCLWALKQIKDEKPMNVVAFAHFFLLDFLINILYTFLFASIWFLIVTDADNQSALAGSTLESVKDAAGFVDPLHPDVTRVHVIAAADPNPLNGQHASIVAETGSSIDPGSAGTTFGIVSIGFFWLIKTYLIIVVFSYARSLVIRSHLSALSFSLKSGLWDKAQRWMLTSGYWREDDADYKQTSHRVVS